MTTITTYGPGGYDPDDPDGNVAEERTVEDDDDVVARNQATDRLRELYEKGWTNLAASEKAEVPKLVVETFGTR